MRKYTIPVLLLILVLVVAVAAAIVLGRRDSADRAARAQSPGPAETTAPVGTTGTVRDRDDVVTTGLFRSIAKRENPIVVAITTESRIKAPDVRQLFGNDDFFQRFFGVPSAPREEFQQALGSGFVITADGEIVTNNHVVAGADQIRVELFGNEHRTYEADVVGRDPLTDSALIRLKNAPGNLPVATLGDSDAIEPGDWVIAIGNPFHLGHTVTAGVISYKGRPFATTEGRFQNMLQTDASINPGNSGGPLIDTRGEVIGVNSAILSGDGSGGNIGIGFAVPINTVKNLLPQLQKGVVQRGQLGVQILSAPITEADAKNLGLPKAEGAIVSRVEPGSAAEDAGLRAGDIVVEYNNQPVQDADHLTAMVVSTPPNTKAPIVFYRNGQKQNATATIAALNLENSQQPTAVQGSAPGFGLSLGNVTADIADELRLPPNVQGAVVENVEPFTPASDAGVKRGDVIVEVDRKAVHSAADASSALHAISAGEPAYVLLWRDGVQQFAEMRRE